MDYEHEDYQLIMDSLRRRKQELVEVLERSEIRGNPKYGFEKDLLKVHRVMKKTMKNIRAKTCST